MSKPRLLVLTSTYPRWVGDHEPGFVHELSRRLTGDFEVHVLCPHAPDTRCTEIMDDVRIHRFRYAPADLETLVQDGGIVNNLRHRPWKWLLVPFFLSSLMLHIARLGIRLRPDCLHAHWIVPQGLALLPARPFMPGRPPVLLTSHGGDLFGLRGTLMAGLKRRVIKMADAMTVVSHPMVELAQTLGARADRLAVIPMGVDFSNRFSPDSACPRRAAELLFVGRLVEKKGLHHLIDALPYLLARVPEATLTIVGYGPAEAALRSRVATLGLGDAVTFLGATPQHELPALYRRAALFVAPFVQAASGDQEGLPVALMEAIACGCPVLVGDLPAMDDLFNADEADMRILPGDPDALAGRIAALLANPDTAGLRAERLRHRLVAQLDWSAIAARYSVLLHSLMHPRN